MAASDELARWVRLLQWAERGLAVVAVLLGGFAVAIIISDESAHDDYWDGFGTWAGLILGGFSVSLLVAAGVLLALTAAGWRRAIDRGVMGVLRCAAGLTIGTAVGWLFIAVVIVSDLKDLGLAIALFVPCVVLFWPALMVLIASTRRRLGSALPPAS